MGEIFARLTRDPAATARLLLASLVVNLLGLASSLYVMQVLSRYVGQGVGGTLATLTVGVMLAVYFEHSFRTARLELAGEIIGERDERLATGLFGLLLTARLTDLDARPRDEGEELARGLERAEASLGAPALAAVADVPFSLFFLLVLTLLSVPLGVVASVFTIAIALFAWVNQRRLEAPVKAAQAAQRQVASLVASAAAAPDAVRQFRAGGLMMARWSEVSSRARGLRAALAARTSGGASLIQAAQALMATAVIAVGATLVVDGKLEVGALIGANLIAARALAPVIRLAQSGEALKQAEASLRAARAFAAQVAVEPAHGATLARFGGRLELKGVCHAPPGQPLPLFSGLDLMVEPGGVLAVTGRNGSGKSTLLRLMVGLTEPSQGQILADGVDIRQLAPHWWRGQVSYMPQEPVFLDGPLRDSLATARLGLSEADLLRCLERADLGRFVAEHPLGLDRPLAQGGRTLAAGIRRRMALARALAVDGPLVVLDEPSEGLDREGTEVVYSLLIDLARAGRTIVVVSHDANILRGAQAVLTLDAAGPQLVRNKGGA